MSVAIGRPVLPGATLGVLGSGQLGRMFAMAARQMGYRVHVYSPEADSPAGQVADREVIADYTDKAALHDFAEHIDAVTFEFENVPAEAGRILAEHVPVRPGGDVLHVCQNRLREKSFIRDADIPVTPFEAVRSVDDLRAALEKHGTPAVLKTAGFGYDGKGQVKIERGADADAAWAEVDTDEAVLEAFIDFDCEVSVVAGRGVDGRVVPFSVCLNDHANHILDVTVMPAPVDEAVKQQAINLATCVMTSLNVVGVLCCEMFVTRGGEVLINELAPRPHNSGHLTIEACETSQFEQQVRALCGLPLGTSRMRRRAAAMVNLLGDLWAHGEPDWAAVYAMGDVHVHLYGKAEARPGRKMGHLTVLGEDAGTVRRRALEARERLARG